MLEQLKAEVNTKAGLSVESPVNIDYSSLNLSVDLI